MRPRRQDILCFDLCPHKTRSNIEEIEVDIDSGGGESKCVDDAKT
ncbi:hypothetical protein AALP_AA3G196800 [Arabis alpina]|uniref:Uncharacterized protein n=1 Tax=Arabis alpina TaxID=50452 RepID=A0A087HAB7_ARAAL|nr:hypothetical protein AALP_AA3G196800 [Arabis alpina]